MIPFWVRAYDFPLRGRMNVENARTVGNKVGTFIDVDALDVVGINKSMRVRAPLDARKPLVDTIRLKIKGGTKAAMNIKYEKLPLFCYVCGLLGHGEKYCDENKGSIMAITNYTDDLRASPWKANRDGRDEVTLKERPGCAKKLLVTKKKPTPSREEVECVSSVVRQLDTVTLSTTRLVDEQPKLLAAHREVGIGSVVIGGGD